MRFSPESLVTEEVDALAFANSLDLEGLGIRRVRGWTPSGGADGVSLTSRPHPVSADAAAEVNAMLLLKSWLSPQQLSQYEKSGYFDVRGSDTGKVYRLHHSRLLNVERLEDRARLCISPVGHLAVSDILLAQKIALETSETETLKTAHVWVYCPSTDSYHVWVYRPSTDSYFETFEAI
jgi:hypothetical protein